MTDETSSPPVEVPSSALTKDALRSLIEAFILREGTDYGANEVAFEQKYKQVFRSVEKDEVKIIFDPSTESVTLMHAQDFAKLMRRLS